MVTTNYFPPMEPDKPFYVLAPPQPLRALSYSDVESRILEGTISQEDWLYELVAGHEFSLEECQWIPAGFKFELAYRESAHRQRTAWTLKYEPWIWGGCLLGVFLASKVSSGAFYALAALLCGFFTSRIFQAHGQLALDEKHETAWLDLAYSIVVFLVAWRVMPFLSPA